MRKVVASAFTVLFLASVAPAVAQTTHRVTSLSSDVTTGYPAWAKRESTCNQTSTGDLLGPPGPADVTTGEVRLGPYTDGLQFSAVLSTFPAADFTLADIERLGYEERAVGGMDGYNAPYLRIFTTTDGTDFHSVIFSPSTQSGGPGSSLNWRRHEITAGTVRYDDDPGNAPDITWNELIALHGSDRVIEIRIQGGCSGAYSEGSTGYVDTVMLDVKGREADIFDFGASGPQGPHGGPGVSGSSGEPGSSGQSVTGPVGPFGPSGPVVLGVQAIKPAICVSTRKVRLRLHRRATRGSISYVNGAGRRVTVRAVRNAAGRLTAVADFTGRTVNQGAVGTVKVRQRISGKPRTSRRLFHLCARK